MPDKDERAGTFKGKTELLLYFLKGSIRYFVLALFSVLALVVFELIDPKIIGYTVDFVIGDEEAIPEFILNWVEGLGGRTYVLDHLWLVSLIVIGIALFGALANFCYKLFTSMGAESLVRRMRDLLYKHIVHLPNTWLDSNKTGDIIQRCTSDVEMIKHFISEQMTSLFRIIVMIVLSLIFMFRIHKLLTLATFIFVPIVILRSVKFHSRIGEAFQKCDEEEGRLSAIVQENLTGVRVVRAFGRESYEKDRFESKNEAYTKLWIRMMYILGNFWVVTDILCGLQVLVVLALGSYFAVKGELTAGSFVAFATYNSLLSMPVRQMGRLVSEMSKAGVSTDRILYIMNSRCEADAPDALDYPGTGDIVFEHVSFAYDTGEEEKKYILKDLNMTIRKGQTVGILGSTGSGKSTLIQLLDGFYELPPEGGRITIGGTDIRRIKKEQLRSHIGMVLQEPYLFSRSLEENVRIAADGSDHEEVRRASRISCLDSAVEKFRDGYNTFVGERGVTLSGGQKQRTAIAQMLIRKPDIMVFDDSLSAVDAATDARIRGMLAAETENTTTLLISHRITTLMSADQIYVLEDGTVAEHGTHEQLLSAGGRYRQIYDLQISQGR